MQLTEQQINLLRELLERVEYGPASPTQEKVHKALEALDGLRAQADAQPVAWQYRSHGSGHWMTTTKEVHDDYRDRGITECRELFIHPAAPALPEEPTAAALEAIAGKPWQMCGNGMQDDAQPVAELKGGVQNRAARYFVYDGENGYQEYVTDAERANAHASIIRSYLDHDDGWFEGVTDIVSGIVTHVTGKSHSVLNPEHEAICECEACEEYRDAGGSNEFSEICDYKVEPLIAATPQPVAWVRYCSDGTFEGPIMDTDIRMNGAHRTSGAWTPLYAHPSAEIARADELRHALYVARDQMRVMANWVKFSDPAAYSWSCNAITIVNAVLAAPTQQEGGV